MTIVADARVKLANLLAEYGLEGRAKAVRKRLRAEFKIHEPWARWQWSMDDPDLSRARSLIERIRG